MFEGPMPTGLWVSACLARLAAAGAAGYVVRKGPETGGALLVKVSRVAAGVDGAEDAAAGAFAGPGHARVFSQVRDLEGRLAWLPAFAGRAVAEAEADAYIARSIARDPDVWVVEIEDPAGRNPFEGPELPG